MATTKFVFKAASGKTISLPPYKEVPMGVVHDLQDFDNEVKATFFLIEQMGGAKAVDAARSFTAAEFAEFSKAWAADSGLELGESTAS
ncbi:MAG: hypothetical protein ACKOAF_05460 [Actinomycetes bacterium]